MSEAEQAAHQVQQLLATVGPEPVRIDSAAVLVALASCSVSAGFPSPAEDFSAKRIDLTEQLITHPAATFLAKVSGDSMKEDGIWDGDVLVVNRAIQARHNHIVMAVVDGEFTVKRLHMRNGKVRLVAANPTYPDVIPKEGQTLTVWGVVQCCIKRFPV